MALDERPGMFRDVGEALGCFAVCIGVGLPMFAAGWWLLFG
jgi:hypothetical protein